MFGHKCIKWFNNFCALNEKQFIITINFDFCCFFLIIDKHFQQITTNAPGYGDTQKLDQGARLNSKLDVSLVFQYVLTGRHRITLNQVLFVVTVTVKFWVH